MLSGRACCLLNIGAILPAVCGWPLLELGEESKIELEEGPISPRSLQNIFLSGFVNVAMPRVVCNVLQIFMMWHAGLRGGTLD